MKYSPIAALILWYVVIYDTHLSHRPKQNGRHFVYEILKCIYLYEYLWGLLLL